MLILLTNKCLENCTHCLQSATPDSESHMALTTVKAVITFLNKHKPKVIILSGGEITCHPHWAYIVATILGSLSYPCAVLLQSNGHFVTNENQRNEMVRILNTRWPYAQGLCLCVNSDRRYYPNYNEFCQVTEPLLNQHFGSKVSIIKDGLSFIYPLGRGELHADSSRCTLGPSCINTYLAAKQTPNFETMFKALETKAVFCKPCVSSAGALLVGESNACSTVGYIGLEDDAVMFERLRTGSPCNKCGMYAEKYQKILNSVEKKL